MSDDLMLDTIIYRESDGESLTEQLHEAFLMVEHYQDMSLDRDFDDPMFEHYEKCLDDGWRLIEMLRALL